MSVKKQQNQITGAVVPEVQQGQMGGGVFKETNMPMVQQEINYGNANQWGSLVQNAMQQGVQLYKNLTAEDDKFDDMEAFIAANNEVNDVMMEAEKLSYQDRVSFVNQKMQDKIDYFKKGDVKVSDAYLKSFMNVYTGKLSSYENVNNSEIMKTQRADYVNSQNEFIKYKLENGSNYSDITSTLQNGRYAMSKKEAGAMYISNSLALIKDKLENQPGYDWKQDFNKYLNIKIGNGSKLTENVDYNKLVYNAKNYLEQREAEIFNQKNKELKLQRETNYKDTLSSLYVDNANYSQIKENIIANRNNYTSENYKSLLKEVEGLKNNYGFAEKSNPESYALIDRDIQAGIMTKDKMDALKHTLSPEDYKSLSTKWNTKENTLTDKDKAILTQKKEGMKDLEKDTKRMLAKVDKFGFIEDPLEKARVDRYSKLWNNYLTSEINKTGVLPELDDMYKKRDEIVKSLYAEEEAVKNAETEQQRIKIEQETKIKKQETFKEFNKEEKVNDVRNRIYTGDISQETIKTVENVLRNPSDTSYIKDLENKIMNNEITIEEIQIIKNNEDKLLSFSKREPERQKKELTGYSIDNLKSGDIIDIDWGPFDTNDVNFEKLNDLEPESKTKIVSKLLKLYNAGEISLSKEDLRKLELGGN